MDSECDGISGETWRVICPLYWGGWKIDKVPGNGCRKDVQISDPDNFNWSHVRATAEAVVLFQT
jgi:hypothetical protein